MLGEHVVERQFLRTRATILAGELVAEKDLAAREPHPGSRPLDEVVQTDDRRHAECAAWRAQDETVNLQDLRLAAIDKYDCTSWVAHVQRLVVLVENEHLPHEGLP